MRVRGLARRELDWILSGHGHEAHDDSESSIMGMCARGHGAARCAASAPYACRAAAGRAKLELAAVRKIINNV